MLCSTEEKSIDNPTQQSVCRSMNGHSTLLDKCQDPIYQGSYEFLPQEGYESLPQGGAMSPYHRGAMSPSHRGAMSPYHSQFHHFHLHSCSRSCKACCLLRNCCCHMTIPCIDLGLKYTHMEFIMTLLYLHVHIECNVDEINLTCA